MKRGKYIRSKETLAKLSKSLKGKPLSEECKRKLRLTNYKKRGEISSLDFKLRKKYNISESEYYDMVKKQDGKCFACGLPPKNCRLSVDHNHTTGRVRCLLCRPCNQALGLVKENVQTLENLKIITRL